MGGLGQGGQGGRAWPPEVLARAPLRDPGQSTSLPAAGCSTSGVAAAGLQLVPHLVLRLRAPWPKGRQHYTPAVRKPAQRASKAGCCANVRRRPAIGAACTPAAGGTAPEGLTKKTSHTQGAPFRMPAQEWLSRGLGGVGWGAGCRQHAQAGRALAHPWCRCMVRTAPHTAPQPAWFSSSINEFTSAGPGSTWPGEGQAGAGRAVSRQVGGSGSGAELNGKEADKYISSRDLQGGPARLHVAMQAWATCQQPQSDPRAGPQSRSKGSCRQPKLVHGVACAALGSAIGARHRALMKQ